MKDPVEIGHLIKYDAFSLNRNRVTDLEMWFKIHANLHVYLDIMMQRTANENDACLRRIYLYIHI